MVKSPGAFAEGALKGAPLGMLLTIGGIALLTVG